MRACDGMRPRAHTSRQTESICLSWRWAEVDGIDLDPSHSFLHSAPPPFLSYFVFSRGCHSQSHTANHLSRRLRSHSQRGKFGFQQRALDFARAAQNVLANNHPSVSECGLFGRTFRLWILNREWLLEEKLIWNDWCVILKKLQVCIGLHMLSNVVVRNYKATFQNPDSWTH